MCALGGLEGDRENEWKEPHPPADHKSCLFVRERP